MECFNVPTMARQMGLKVCQLCAVDFTVKHFLLPLIDGMQKEGWEVISVCSDGPYVKKLRAKGYKFITVNISRNYNLFSHIISIYRLYKLFNNEKFDVLHVHTPIAALIGRLAGRLAGIKVVIYTAHGFFFHDDMSNIKRNFFIFLEKFASQFHHLLFIQSSEDFRFAIKLNLARKNCILEIGNGINPNLFNPLSRKEKYNFKRVLKIPNNSQVIGIIGRLVKEKGYIEFISAILTIFAEYKNLHVIIVGPILKKESGQPVVKELKKLKNIMRGQLHMLGYREDIRSILGIMDIFCLPSYREGLPRSIIEAMMLGIPVIATNVRGSRELVEHNKTGLLIKPKNSNELILAIRKLLSDNRLAKDYGNKGHLIAIKQFNEKFVIRKQILKLKTYLGIN